MISLEAQSSVSRTPTDNSLTGATPRRCLAWVIAEPVGTCQSSLNDPIVCRLPTRRRITSSTDSCAYRPIAITYRIITCAGSNRLRFSRHPVRLITSSIRSRWNRAASTPRPMWSVNLPDGCACDITPGTVPAPQPEPQLTTLTSVDALSERHWVRPAGRLVLPDTSFPCSSPRPDDEARMLLDA